MDFWNSFYKKHSDPSFKKQLKGVLGYSPGNTLEALVGAIYLDKGYKKTSKWVSERIIIPHMFVDDLEVLEINHKNKLYGWANKNGKMLEFETINEQMENGRRLFTIAAVINGKVIAQGKAFNKKDASQIAAQLAVAKLGIVNSDSPSFD